MSLCYSAAINNYITSTLDEKLSKLKTGVRYLPLDWQSQLYELHVPHVPSAFVKGHLQNLLSVHKTVYTHMCIYAHAHTHTHTNTHTHTQSLQTPAEML